MSKEQIKKEIRELKQTVENAPRILKFRGRRVVDEWRYGDWTRFPNGFNLFGVMGSGVPKDWRHEYFALLEKLQDPDYARSVCYYCVVNQAQMLKQELDRHRAYWDEEGEEGGKEEFYASCGEPQASEFKKQDAMRDVEWRLYDEHSGANNRTCAVLNFFKCPYGSEWQALIEDGGTTHEIWKHIEWYDRHWNRDTSRMLPQADMKWYHFNYPPIIDVKSLEDILKASDDGRLDKIIQEHERYMKETGAQIWNL